MNDTRRAVVVGARPCVPQVRHVHNLLARGQSELESLFPGFIVELEAAGAVSIDIALEIKMLSVFDWFPRHQPDLLDDPASLFAPDVLGRALATG